MANRTERRRRNRKPESTHREQEGSARPLGLSHTGLALGGAGVIVAILGFWLVAQGSITAAPLLLVLAYLVLIPLALVR